MTTCMLMYNYNNLLYYVHVHSHAHSHAHVYMYICVFCIIKLVSLNLVVSIPIQAVSLIPKPSLARLDPNDPNMIIGIPDEPVVSMETTTKDGKKVFLKIYVYIYLTLMCKNV